MASAAAPTPSRPLLEPASRALLEGLGSLHAVVVAFDDDGRVVFAHDPDALLGANACEQIEGRFEGVRAATPAARAVAAGLAGEPPPDEHHRFHVFDTAGDSPRTLRVVLLDPTAEPAAADLARKNEELETCLHSVSHDLRSPLVSVLGFARLLRDEFGEPIGRTGQHFLDRIEQAGRNMERLLHDLLELTRMDEMPNTPVHVNPIAVLEQLSAEQKLALDAAGITLVLPGEAPIVVCDRTRLYQLFSNLVGNALRFVPTDGSGRIEIRIEAHDDGWRIDVDDNGPGIAPEDRARIFEPFRTARHPGQAPEARKSSGLGLAIVRKIVEAHDGRIHVEDAPGGGARFRVWLPRPAEPTDETAKAASA